MTTVINKLSQLVPKLRFEELQNTARQICYRYFEVDGDFSQIYEDVDYALATTPDEHKEQEKMLLHFLVYRNIQRYGKGEELTDISSGEDQ
ncbi:hypothetical protein MX551_004046 [Salmonella enterica]|nr:hypothetical protein [Salmonella enterica]EDR4377410.1 hypothetical protein [Salmonella enterica]EEG5734289.1 hypothetical protein [Salmonella enterica]EEG6158310.1 hypothetical protein [Salmonella enterica]EEH7434641.1 hypothetical protein [Salmonella enterica]